MMKLFSEDISTLITGLWSKGFIVTRRKDSPYIPAPEKIGGYDVDLIARRGNDYALALILDGESVRQGDMLNKISYLATRKTKYSGRDVYLYLSIDDEHALLLKALVGSLDDKIKRNIRIYVRGKKQNPDLFSGRSFPRIQFS